MALYEYRCRSCGNEFELMRGMSQMNEPAKCPRCGKIGGERLVSVFAASNTGVGVMVSTKPAFRGPAKPVAAEPTRKPKGKAAK